MSDLADRLPLDTRAKCAAPMCDARVSCPGEFCAACRSIQEQMKATLRKNNAQIVEQAMREWLWR